MNHLSIGRLGENIAAKYLKHNGYKVLRRNYRKTYGEIDIVARDNKGTLVFAEVKTIRAGAIDPEEHLTLSKLNKVKRMALAYTKIFPNEVDDRLGFRIDLIAITIKTLPKLLLLTDYGRYCDVKHYQNI